MVELTVLGTAEMSDKLQQLMQQVPTVVGNALREEGEIEMTEAKRRTPVLTGALRASGHVTGPTFNDGIQVVLAFGGPAADYALYVHENLAAHHENGENKFLESVVLESAQYMPQRIATRIEKDLK